MWAHIFICNKCGQEIKMVTNEMANPMRDRTGLHSSMYDEGASAYYHGATISLLRKQDSTCHGTLKYLHERVARELVRDVYDPNAKVTEGTLGKVTETLWQALPAELQKKLVNVLSATAPPQGGQGIKALTGNPRFQGVAYTYELKFLGAYGNHRCYGNKVGNKVEFTVYDPGGTLH